MDYSIDISRFCEDWPDIDGRVERAVQATLGHVSYSGAAEISAVLGDDAFIQDLNKRYRGKDKPTNVLSFPQDEDNFDALGDIIFAYETIAREAQEQKKSFEDHLSHLAVHGTLHLLGYDHETDDEAAEMEGLEIEILNTLDIQNPYKDEER